MDPRFGKGVNHGSRYMKQGSGGTTPVFYMFHIRTENFDVEYNSFMHKYLNYIMLSWDQ